MLLGEKFIAALPAAPRIQSVSSVDEAKDILDSGQIPNLILLDLSMPGPDGFDLLEDLRNRKLHSVSIVLSASEDVRDMQRAHELGAKGFIGKFEPAEILLDKICTVVEGSECYPETLYQYLQESPVKKRLTPRQIEVLTLISLGKSNKQISRELGVSEATVKFHVSETFQALGVHNRTTCVREGIKQGWIPE